MILRTAAAFVLAGSLMAGTAQLAQAQDTASNSRRQRDCVLRQEPNGLIRGGSQPKGCVLVLAEDATRQQAPDAPGIVCEETVIHTTNVKKTVLSNCVRLSDGRIVIPTVPPSEEAVEQRHFGPLQRHFGAIQSNFGPLERHFGPLQRNFGSSSQSKSGGKQP